MWRVWARNRHDRPNRGLGRSAYSLQPLWCRQCPSGSKNAPASAVCTRRVVSLEAVQVLPKTFLRGAELRLEALEVFHVRRQDVVGGPIDGREALDARDGGLDRRGSLGERPCRVVEVVRLQLRGARLGEQPPRRAAQQNSPFPPPATPVARFRPTRPPVGCPPSSLCRATHLRPSPSNVNPAARN